MLLILLACLPWQHAYALEIYAELNPPSVYKTKDGTLKGYFHDYVNEILKRTDTKATIRTLPWNRAYLKTLNYEDTGVFPTARTEEREHSFKWVGPIGVSYWSLFKRQEDEISFTTIQDAKEVEGIGVVLGSARESYLRELGFENVVTAFDHSQLHTLLIKQRIRLIASSEVTTINHLRQKGKSLDLLTRLMDYRTCFLYLAFNKQTPDDLIQKLQASLDEIKEEGRLQELRVTGAPPLDKPNQRSLNAVLDLSNNQKGCF